MNAADVTENATDKERSNVSADSSKASPRQMSPALKIAVDATDKERNNVSTSGVIAMSRQISTFFKAPTVMMDRGNVSDGVTAIPRQISSVLDRSNVSAGAIALPRQISSVLETAQNAIREATRTALNLFQHAISDANAESAHISTATSNQRSIDASNYVATTNMQKKRRNSNSQKEKERKRNKVALEAEKMRRAGIEGMLSTTHVMISSGATSKKVRSVVGEAITDVISKQGNMRKERKKERAWIKRTINTTKVRSN